MTKQAPVATRREPARSATAVAPPRSIEGGAAMAAIVDMVFEDGLFFLAVENLDTQPLLKLVAKFDQPIIDASGRDVTRLALFRRVEFLAPRRVIRTFVDSSAGYFARGQPARFSIALTWRDVLGARHRADIVHDVGIYRDLALVTRVVDAPPAH